MQKRKGHQKVVSQFGAHTYSAGQRPDNDESTKFKRLQGPNGLTQSTTPSLKMLPLPRTSLVDLISKHHSSWWVPPETNEIFFRRTNTKYVLTIHHNASSDPWPYNLILTYTVHQFQLTLSPNILLVSFNLNRASPNQKTITNHQIRQPLIH